MLQILSLALVLQSPSIDERIQQPYVELIQHRALYPTEAFKDLRSTLEDARDAKVNAAKRQEKEWKGALDRARKNLKTATNRQRTQLHIDISALEHAIKDKNKEREQTIPVTYETKLAKLWLLQHWPDRRAEILYRIDHGRDRDRQHGDVEDIGYRKLVKNPEKDIEVGQQAARQMIAGGWLPLELQDSDVQLYVRRVAGKIAASSDLKVPLHATVVDSAEPKAIALPGGYLYVTSGLLRTARTESEFAGVLSREIAGMAAQHATRASKRSIVSKMFTPVAQIATGIFSGGINPGAYYGIGYGMQGLGGVIDRVMNGSNKNYQREADQLGVQYAWKAGYDPRGIVTFLDSLTVENQADLVSKEPPLEKRLLNLFSEIQYLRPLEHPVVDTTEFQVARQRVIAASSS